MKKKGFTLIELLAVIAILAILLIVAIPNVIRLYKDAKKKSFVTEAQSIVSTAQKQYMSDQVSSGTSITKRCYDGTSNSYNKLELSGNDTTKYYIEYANDKITKIIVSTPEYSITKDTNANGYDVSDLNVGAAISKGSNGYTSFTCKADKSGITIVGAAEPAGPVATAEACFNYTTANNQVTITDYYIHEGNNSSNDECPTDVVIPGTLGGNPVTTIGESAFLYDEETESDVLLTSVTIPDSVTSIESFAFYNNLIQTVNFGTGLLTIGYDAFGYNDIRTLVIPNTVTSIGQEAFYNNPNLTSVTIGSGISEIPRSAFYSCDIRSVSIPDNITSIGEYSFQDNHNLSSLTFGESSQVSTIGPGAFFNDPITDLTLPASLTSVESGAFSSEAGYLHEVCIRAGNIDYYDGGRDEPSFKFASGYFFYDHFQTSCTD